MKAPAADEPTAVAGLPGGGASAIAHLIGVPLVLASGRGGRAVSFGAAATAAVLTVLAFDVGMGGWMLLLHFNEFMPPATEGSFWFLMQVGILLGLLTGYPVVKWLSQRHQTADGQAARRSRQLVCRDRTPGPGPGSAGGSSLRA